MQVTVDINRAERRSQAKVRRRELAVEGAIRELSAKRAQTQHALELRRAVVLRDEPKPKPIVDACALTDMQLMSVASLGWKDCSTRPIQCGDSDSEGSCCNLPVELLSHDSSAIEKYRLLDGLRCISRPRTRGCCRTRIANTVQVKVDGPTVTIQGVMHCGNVHGCPVCAARIYARRAFEIDSLIDQWIGYGPERKGPSKAAAYMLTFTVRHGVSNSLATTSSGIADAWRAMFAGRAGQNLRKQIGLKHFARSFEATHGQNGWHPHFHIIMLFDDPLSDEEMHVIAERWRHAVESTMGPDFAPDSEHGVDSKRLNEAHDGRYIEKMGLEIAGIYTKGARNGNRTYWGIAQDAAKGDRFAAALWSEAQTALFGRRQLTWSRGTREAFELPDLTDEDIADSSSEEPEKSEHEPFRLDVPSPIWDLAKRADRFFVSRFVGACAMAWESGDASPVLALLSPRLRSRFAAVPSIDGTSMCHTMTPDIDNDSPVSN